ncbi:hypothetical protein EJB05_27288, partial [Eragrostis curvula]
SRIALLHNAITMSLSKKLLVITGFTVALLLASYGVEAKAACKFRDRPPILMCVHNAMCSKSCVSRGYTGGHCSKKKGGPGMQIPQCLCTGPCGGPSTPPRAKPQPEWQPRVRGMEILN